MANRTFTLQQFLEFVESKPAGEHYKYESIRCPIGQFSRANGFEYIALFGNTDSWDAAGFKYAEALSKAEPRTFGALAERLRAHV